MFEELAVTIRSGVIGDEMRNLRNRLDSYEAQARIDIDNARGRQEAANILNSFKSKYRDILEQWMVSHETIKEQKFALEDEMVQVKQALADVKASLTKANEFIKSEQQKSTMLNIKIVELNNLIESIRSEQAEISMKAGSYYRDLKSLEIESVYSQAEIIADGAVRKFLKTIIKKGIQINDLDGHEINIFAMAYEAYIKMIGLDGDPQWRANLATAIESRKEEG